MASSQKAKFDEEAGDDAKGPERKQFELGTSSNSRSFEVESWAFVPHQNYSLQLKQKVDESFVDEKTIPASFHETLSFFRVYTYSVEKTQAFSMSIFDFNRFIWYGVFGFVVKSLPLNYVHLFLASYVPNEHMYITKMVPLMCGQNFVVFLVTMSLFLFASDSLQFLLNYAIRGILESGPWDRCEKASYEMISTVFKLKQRVTCLTTEQFRAAVDMSEKSIQRIMFYELVYQNGTSSKVLPAPILFSRLLRDQFNTANILVGFQEALKTLIMLATIGACRGQTYKKTIWKVINYSHWIINIFYFSTILRIFIYSLENEMTEYDDPTFLKTITAKTVLAMDYEMYADLVGVPPVLHFIASKRKHQINPAGDSATLVFSNSVNYFMKGITTYLLKRYCAHQYKVQVAHSIAGSDAFYFLWPLYMALVPLGAVWTCLFFFLHGLSEFLTYIISFNVALESIQSTWPRLKWWIVLIITFFNVVFIRALLGDNRDQKFILYLFIKGSSAVIDILTIVWLYPMGRLEDDIMFHTGSPPPKALSVAIRILPFYLLIKYYLTVTTIYELKYTKKMYKDTWYMHRLHIYLFTIVTCGMLYTIIKNFITKQNWRALFRPVPQWGPRDHIQRQLRKQFDSREYVASTASRYLSRYLKSKLGSRMYRLDVCYEMDRGRRRSTVVLDSLRYDDEKKKDI